METKNALLEAKVAELLTKMSLLETQMEQKDGEYVKHFASTVNSQ